MDGAKYRIVGLEKTLKSDEPSSWAMVLNNIDIHKMACLISKQINALIAQGKSRPNSN